MSKIGNETSYEGTKPRPYAKSSVENMPSLYEITKPKKSLMEQMMVGNYEEFKAEFQLEVESSAPLGGESLIFADPYSGSAPEAFQYFFSRDHLGTSSYMTDAGGEVIEHLEYIAFGETFIEERSTNYSTPYRYTGKEQDCETGLYYYGARYYDAKVSRFLSVDPLADQYSGWTPYHYVHNNPINLIDPMGLDTAWIPTRHIDHTDVEGYSSFVTEELYRMDINQEESDCADLACKLLIRYASQSGFEVSFTTVSGQIINSTTDQSNSPQEFEKKVLGLTRARSIIADLVPLQVSPEPGDMTNSGTHVNIVTVPNEGVDYPFRPSINFRKYTSYGSTR